MDVRQHLMDDGRHVMDVRQHVMGVGRHVTHVGQSHDSITLQYWVHVECLLLQQLANANVGAVALETVFIWMQCSHSIRNSIHLNAML